MTTVPFENVVEPEADSAVSFIRASYPQRLFDRRSDETKTPFVTLTYAQSLDAKIAGKAGKQLILSGNQSMLLTHRLREFHDSILVGIGTLLNDDPQLNARLPSLLPVALQPTPIILDRSLQTPPDCKLLRNHSAGIGKAPVIVQDSACESDLMVGRRRDLEAAGAIVIPVRFDDGAHLSMAKLVNEPDLQVHLGRSLMVEGGSAVISGFLGTAEIDLVVATVAPVYVGEGVPLCREGTRVPELEHVKTQIFGNDTVFASKPIREGSSPTR